MPSEILCTTCEEIQICIETMQQLLRVNRILGPPEFMLMSCKHMGRLNKTVVEYLFKMAERDTQKRVSTYTA